MAAQKGLALLIQVLTTGSTYATVGGMQNARLTINGEAADITNADSSGRWRELLAEVGVRSVSAAGDGVFKDDAPFAKIEGHARVGTFAPLKLVVPAWGTYGGDFNVASLQISGAHNGAVQFSGTFESAGAVTFTGAT